MKTYRHKSVTVEGLRERLKAVIGKAQRRDCPTCHGAGQIERPLTQAEVIAAVQLSPSQYHAFVKQGKAVTLETGLRLLNWLDEMEREPLDELDAAHQPRDLETTERESARMRQLKAVSAKTAADAAIDARERPIQFRETA